METVATSVRIAGDAVATLSRLASKLGQPKAQVVQRALRELEERVFWSEVHEAFARDAADTGEQVQAKTEITVWEKASESDFRDEKW